jgi:DNA-binding LytR/AlgR family response regulator
MMGSMAALLDVLVTDDELPAIDDLAKMLRKDPRIGHIYTASSGVETLRILEQHPVDALFLDIHMPGLTGLDIAKVINRFAVPPAVVFVTADEAHAVQAFELKATDYLLKPIEAERLSEAIRRISDLPAHASQQSAKVTVDQGGMSKLLSRDEVLYAEAVRDYVRLHTQESSYLVRVSMSELARQWGDENFLRIHRSYLVAIKHVRHVKLGTTDGTVYVGSTELPVSRRNLPLVRDMLEKTRVRPRR